MRMCNCLVLAVLMAITVGASAAEYSVTDLGSLGGKYMIGAGDGAFGINNHGDVVGCAHPSSTSYHAFVYLHGGTTTDLGTLGGSKSEGAGINDSGQVVGYSDTTAQTADNWHAFLCSNGVMQDVGTLGGPQSQAYAINAGGDVVGWADTDGRGIHHAFLLHDGVMSDLGTLGGTYSEADAVNDSRQVVGTSAGAGFSGYHAFLHSNDTILDLGALNGDTDSGACGINASGRVVGYSYNSSVPDTCHAFLYTDGRMQDLGSLGGSISWASAINASGDVVGQSSVSADGDDHAFLYRSGQMADLNALVPADCGLLLENATAINDVGQIVGMGTDSQGNIHAFLLTPAPEPGALSLLTVGGLMALMRRKIEKNERAVRVGACRPRQRAGY